MSWLNMPGVIFESGSPTPPEPTWVDVTPTYSDGRRIGSDNKIGNHAGDALTIYRVYANNLYIFKPYSAARFGFFTSTANGSIMVESTMGAGTSEYKPTEDGYLIATNSSGTHLDLLMKYCDAQRIFIGGDLFCGREGQVSLSGGKVYETVNASRTSIIYPVSKGKQYLISNAGAGWSYGFVDEYPHNNQTYEQIANTGVLFTPVTDGYVIAYIQQAKTTQPSQVSYFV